MLVSGCPDPAHYCNADPDGSRTWDCAIDYEWTDYYGIQHELRLYRGRFACSVAFFHLHRINCAACCLIVDKKNGTGTVYENRFTEEVIRTASKMAGIPCKLGLFSRLYVFCGLCADDCRPSSQLECIQRGWQQRRFCGMSWMPFLAVVIGGTSLNWWSFLSTWVPSIGALIIQTLTTTIYMIGSAGEVTLVV